MFTTALIVIVIIVIMMVTMMIGRSPGRNANKSPKPLDPQQARTSTKSSVAGSFSPLWSDEISCQMM